MGECTNFFTAKRSDLRKVGKEGQKAFWQNGLGVLNKAAWFDFMLWVAPKELDASEEDHELICSGLHSDHENPLTVGLLEYVIKRLQALDKKVLSMPCDQETDHAEYSIDTKTFELAISGTPQGEAMMEEVYKVLFTSCDRAFVYPWENKNREEWGTVWVQQTLKKIIEKYNRFNVDGGYALYKTTG